MTVTSKAIRVQLPGGDIYAPALLQAATKTADRSDLSSRKRTALKQLVHASIVMLNSGSPDTITLEMTLDGHSIEVAVVGAACGRSTKRLVGELAALADKKAQSFSNDYSKTARTVQFRI